jgi:hypothetical protein
VFQEYHATQLRGSRVRKIWPWARKDLVLSERNIRLSLRVVDILLHGLYFPVVPSQGVGNFSVDVGRMNQKTFLKHG